MIYFQWDSKKNEENIKKHGVSFNEAASVFFDNEAKIFADLKHSHFEARFKIVGKSHFDKMLLVVFTNRKAMAYEKEICRIISARGFGKFENHVEA